MRATLWLVLTAASALAENNRRTKLPYIADAVGNSLPPPSSVPATVGSPVNLLTPDRYEFYTFDESGELVKRLMTLEEIQAIVAAGEETEGLVTFANDNQPTIAFNFTQPSQTKVHSVVTNVQNVLKAQMEAHRNKPNIQPTLDTPDVSDSWSLILPSIFGNTGVDIVPDKASGLFITPETETFEIDNLNDYKNSQSKESNEIPTISTFHKNDDVNKNFISTAALTTIQNTTPVSLTPSTSTTPKPYLTTTTKRPEIKTTKKTATSRLPTFTSPTTLRTTTSTTLKPTVAINNTNSQKQNKTQESLANSNNKHTYNITKIIQNISSLSSEPVQYERVSTFSPISTSTVRTFSPISTSTYITEKSTKKPITTTKNSISNKTNTEKLTTTTAANNIMTRTTSLPIFINKEKQYEKSNSTTITTQSVSPFTTVSSTEFIINTQTEKNEQKVMITDINDYNKENESIIPMFDVAQSISQIASDLGNNFVPIPTSNSLIDTTKTNSLSMESKENVEIDIPTESGDGNLISTTTIYNLENLVKISTFDPQERIKNKTLQIIDISKDEMVTTVATPLPLPTLTSSTSPSIMDAVISESMGDLLSQVVRDGPDPTSIIISQNNSQSDNNILTIQNPTHYTPSDESTSLETLVKIEKLTTTTSSPPLILESQSEKTKIPTKEIKTNIDNETSKINNKNIPSTTIKGDVNEIILASNKLNENTQSEILISNSLVDNLTNQSIQNVLDLENKLEKISVGDNQIPLINLSSEAKPTKTNLSTDSMNFTFINNTYLLTNKTAASDNNKIGEIKHKVMEEVPKVDEFKKKIQKVNIDEIELANERNNSWKLIPTVKPPKANEDKKDKHKVEGFYTPETNDNKYIVLEYPKENQGLEVTTKNLGDDILQFAELCNELAFRYWNVMVESVDIKRSLVFSPYSITSMLAMMFMGAKGATSGEMNEVLKLDDMVTFNPHFTLKNISDSIETTSASGVAISAFIRELYSERNKGKMLTFYKERAQHFYNGHVEEINFKLISDVVRRRTNLLVKRYTWGKIPEYLKTNSITMNPPLAAFSANIFYTDCTGSSVEGRDGEMYFVVSPNVRQRRLVPVPAVVYKSNFLAGYDPVLDATAAALGNTNSVVSTLFLMPGQQGNIVHADDLENLEKRLLDTNMSTAAWNGLLRTLLPRFGLELQIPRFSHKSIFNVSATLKKMGLKELFDVDHADLGGLNGPSKDLYLSDMLQLTTFVTCGEGVIGEQHHVEEYPDTLDSLRKRRTSRWITGWDEPRDYQRAFHDPHDVGDAMHLPLHLRPRQARLPARSSQPARLKFDRPFLFFVRHNPSGMILYVGRYNPRLLP